MPTYLVGNNSGISSLPEEGSVSKQPVNNDGGKETPSDRPGPERPKLDRSKQIARDSGWQWVDPYELP